jgi:hypothetical protein
MALLDADRLGHWQLLPWLLFGSHDPDTQNSPAGWDTRATAF